MSSRKPVPIDATRVSFRLPPEVAAKLAERATEDGKSHNLVARDLLAQVLEGCAEQGHGLSTLHDEPASVQVAGPAAAMTAADFGLLLAQLAELSNAVKASEDQSRRLEALCKERLASRDTCPQAEERQLQLLKTIAADLAVVRTISTAMDQVSNTFTSFCTVLNQLDVDPKQFHKLRSDLASSVNVLLVNAGKLTPEQAKAWVQQTLLSR
ncbi:MAG: hypothetical protein ABFC77_11055 [Thermoguttaceae bacterium]